MHRPKLKKSEWAGKQVVAINNEISNSTKIMENPGIQVSQLTSETKNAAWAIAVFAHNESKGIRKSLQSIAATIGEHAFDVYVLANGCTDSTAKEVRACADLLPSLYLVETPVADKANAWNLFVHDLIPPEKAQQFETYFFMDGDVTLAPGTLPSLASALDEVRSADAAGAMPACGRDRVGWSNRMVRFGMLAGNCYALRGSFVRLVQERKVRMPVGLIGEDFFVSWLVANDAWRDPHPNGQASRIIFHKEAEFSFRSLSRWRPSDYRTYLRRKWRYTLRGLQHQMLLRLLSEEGIDAMPADVQELYRRATPPSRLRWIGRETPLRTMAVQWIRYLRNRPKQV